MNCSAGRLPTRSIKFGQRVVPHLRLQAQALRITADLGHMRWLLFEQRGRSIPILFLVILVFWLAIIFVSFGLFAPQNATVVATLLLCALSVSGVIFLILDLNRHLEVLRIKPIASNTLPTLLRCAVEAPSLDRDRQERCALRPSCRLGETGHEEHLDLQERPFTC